MTVHLISDRSDVTDSIKKGPSAALRLVPVQPAPAAAATWQLESHVCRVCFARIVSRPTAAGLIEYQCTNCGAAAEGAEVSSLCACGVKIRKSNSQGRHGGPLLDAGIRCMANPKPTPEFPSLFVATEVPQEQRAQRA